MTRIEIPGLGKVTKDQYMGWYVSRPVKLALLNGSKCTVVLDGYDEDRQPMEFHVAIANLLACDFRVLRSVEKHIFNYYKKMNSNWDPSDDGYISIKSASDVWNHVQFGSEPMVTRRVHGDKGIYVSIPCNCDWEREHGLQLVLKNGKKVVKVGPCDGHLTNSDASPIRALKSLCIVEHP